MKKGLILVVTLIVMMVLLVMGGGYFSYLVHEKKSSDRETASVSAFYIAEAGLDRALWRLRNGLSGNIQEAFGEGTYSVSVEDMGNLVYRLNSIGETKNTGGDVLATRNLSMYIKGIPFNTYSYLTDSEYFTRTWCWGRWCFSWQVPVWFIGGDQLHGPTRTNSEFHISGDPAFYGPVTSAANEIIYMQGGPPQDNPYFDPAYSPNPRLGANPIELPSFQGQDLQRLKTEGTQFSGDTTIAFRDDGTMDVTNAQQGLVNHNMAVPQNGVFVDGGNLYLSGILKGEVTLGAGEDAGGSKGNIVVADNVRFSDRYDTEGNLRGSFILPAESTDYLGLVAEKNVVISKDAPSDLEVDASIMALGDSFIVERWWDRNYNKGTLTVLGGIIQEERGPVGTFSGSTKTSGYSKNYIYDQRLNTKNLPYFPATGEYQVISWRRE